MHTTSSIIVINTPQNQLVGKIASSSLALVQDQFGNYVVQHLLSTKVQFAPKIIENLLGHIPELSVQKFSSNVIEKCLQVASQEHYSAVIQEITDANLLELLQVHTGHLGPLTSVFCFLSLMYNIGSLRQFCDTNRFRCCR